MLVLIIFPFLALPVAFAQLNRLAKANGKYFGSALDNPILSDAPYIAILSDTNEFGSITVGNTQKWQFTEPNQNSFDYSGGDQIVSYAQGNSQTVRCHTLAWYNQLPGWVTGGSWTKATLTAALQNHIKNEVTHYKGKCMHWDVVNEVFNDDGTYRQDVFYNVVNWPEYIAIAFQAAAEADLNAKLYINDYNLEYNNAKTASTRKLVSDLKAQGAKVDGVGFQAHLIVGSTPDLNSLTTLIKSFTDLGVDVAYTELDIRFPASMMPPTAAGLQQQAVDYVNVVKSCTGNSRCVGITVWDFADSHSWIPGVFPGEGAALPWNADLTKKPCYYSIVSALGGSATSTTMRTSTTSARATTTPVRTTTTTTAPRTTTTAPGNGGVSPKWGQCGGQGWTGPTTCAAGSTCTYSNPWYSQCL